MGLNFITARYDERRGVWLFTLRDISRNYTGKWFWIDLVRRPLFLSLGAPLGVPCAGASVPSGSPVQGSCVTAGRGCWCLVVIGAVVAQVSILPFDLVGLLVSSSAVSQLKVLRIVRLIRLIKLVRVLKGSRYVTAASQDLRLAAPLSPFC